MTPSSNNRVVLGLSGGVDSAIAAHLLAERGLEVIAVHLQLADPAVDRKAFNENTETPAAFDTRRARQSADQLGVELVTVDLRDRFCRVIDRFCREYAAGRTPNPCTWCNPQVKFQALADEAHRTNAAWLATGHYARIAERADGTPGLFRGVDPAKDQSYALFGLPRELLGRIRFPLGDRRKEDIKALAQHLNLHAAEHPESQDICFLDNERYTDFLRRRLPERFVPGPIVDTDGNEVGRHDGTPNFTIGQRRGLRVPMGRPVYVVAIDPETNTVTIGDKRDLERSGLHARGVNWLRDEAAPFEARVKIRYRSRPEPARITPVDFDEQGRPQGFHAEFHAPVQAVTPGQAAVVYDGEEVVGGGWIA